jgi:glutamate synthase domain-containing protein 1
MKKMKKPFILLPVKRIARDYGISPYRISRAMDQGRIIPFAVTGDGPTDPVFFLAEQIEELREVCADRPRRCWVKQDQG